MSVRRQHGPLIPHPGLSPVNPGPVKPPTSKPTTISTPTTHATQPPAATSSSSKQTSSTSARSTSDAGSVSQASPIASSPAATVSNAGPASQAAPIASSPAATASAASVPTGTAESKSSSSSSSTLASSARGTESVPRSSNTAAQSTIAGNAITEESSYVAVSSSTSSSDPAPSSMKSPPTPSMSQAPNHANAIIPAVLLSLALATALSALLWYCRRRRQRTRGVSAALFYQDTSVPGMRSPDDAAASFYSLPSAGIFAAGMATPNTEGEACRESSELDIHCAGRSASAFSFAPREIVPVTTTASAHEPSHAPDSPALPSTPAPAQYASVSSPAWRGEPSPTEWTPAPLAPPPARRAPSTRTVGSRASSERLARRNNRLLAALSDTPPSVPSRPTTPASTEIGVVFQQPGQPAELADNPFGDDARVFAL